MRADWANRVKEFQVGSAENGKKDLGGGEEERERRVASQGNISANGISRRKPHYRSGKWMTNFDLWFHPLRVMSKCEVNAFPGPS